MKRFTVDLTDEESEILKRLSKKNHNTQGDYFRRLLKVANILGDNNVLEIDGEKVRLFF